MMDSGNVVNGTSTTGYESAQGICGIIECKLISVRRTCVDRYVFTQFQILNQLNLFEKYDRENIIERDCKINECYT